MTLTIDISPQLESRIRTEADKQGLNADEYVINALQEHLRHTGNDEALHLTEKESDLLQKINIGLPEETWQHYHKLIAKRRCETLTPDEQTTLIEISDRIEQLNVTRIQYLAELARLRKVKLPVLMQQLGVRPLPYV